MKKPERVQDTWARWMINILRGQIQGFVSYSPIENVETISASGSTCTLADVNTATMHDVTLTANCTFTFPALGAGKSFRVLARQDGTGSRVPTWPASVEWPAGIPPTLSTVANEKDLLRFRCFDGSKWEGVLDGKNFRSPATPATIVRSAIATSSGGTSLTATLGSTPTVGNILVWVVSKYSARSSSPGTGTWTQRGLSPSGQGNASVDVYTRTVQTGDGTSWVMNQLFGATDGFSGGLYEISGSDGAPAGWTYTTQGASSSPLSESITQTYGLLLLVGCCPNGGTTFGGLTLMTPSGYTQDRQIVNGASDSLIIGHVVATGAAQTIGTSWDGSNGDAIQVVIAVNS